MDIDYLRYKETMHSLLAKDIDMVLSLIRELESIISLGRVSVAEDSGTFIGWLRWNLFWDNTPFLNMLFCLIITGTVGMGKKCSPIGKNR